MPEAKNSTPSQKLYDKLLTRMLPSLYTISALKGRTIFLVDEGLMGPVVDISVDEFLYQPQIKTLSDGNLKRIDNAEEELVIAYDIDLSTPPAPALARTKPPKMIGFGGTGPSHNLNFAPHDPYLDKILKKALAEIPKVENANDLSTLTKWVHEEIPYNHDNRYSARREGLIPVGELIEKRGAVCRHIAAVELALLELYEVPSVTALVAELYNPSEQLAAMKRGDNYRTTAHMYLNVVIDDVSGLPDMFIADPTNNLVTPKNNYKRDWEVKSGMTFSQEFRRPYQPMW